MKRRIAPSICRAIAILMILMIAMPFAGHFSCTEVQAVSDVRYGQARNGERSFRNNKPGDQTGKEVMITDWSYSILSIKAEHWQVVMRPKDPEVGRKIAKLMTDACNNDKIGYDQNDSDRGSFYDEAKKRNWDIAGIKKECETTCSCAISVCLNAAGIKVPRLWMTKDMQADLEATGQFYCFTSDKYVKSSSHLAVGDILINPGGHTVLIIESPHPFTYPVTYTDPDGKSRTAQIAEDAEITLNLNNGDGTDSVIADRELDLATDAIKPKKRDFEFRGWRKTSKNSFSAEYTCKVSPLPSDAPLQSTGS